MTAVDFPTPAPGGSPFDMIRRTRPTTYQNQTTGEDIATSTVRVTPKGLDALAHHFNVVIPEEPTNAAA